MINTIVFDVNFLREHILKYHRLPEEEIEDIIQFTYLLLLKEYHRTVFLFRYQHMDIDDNIWEQIPINTLEYEIAEELVYKYYPALEHQIEVISSTRNRLQRVVHFTEFTFRQSFIFISYILE